MEINNFSIFLSSPKDTKKERKIITKVIDEINSSAELSNIYLNLIKWESNSTPGVDSEPQGVIDRQFDEYDIFIGIFNRDFGTPTAYSESGTVHEFERAYEKFIQKKKVSILFYLKNEKIRFHDIKIHDANKIYKFRDRLSYCGILFYLFNDDKEFEKEVKNHIIRTICDLRNGISYPSLKKAAPPLNIQPFKEWIIEPNKGTPQWSNFREIDLSTYNYSSYRIIMNFQTSSQYFRFGFKLITSQGKYFGDFNILTRGDNILYHIGRNFHSNMLFTTLYNNGIRTRENKELFEYNNDGIKLIIEKDKNDMGYFFVNDILDEQLLLGRDLGDRILLLMWGDHNEYHGKITDINITLNCLK